MTITDLDGRAPGERFGFGDRLEIIAAESRRLSDVVASLDLEDRVPSTPESTIAMPTPRPSNPLLHSGLGSDPP